MIETKRRLAGFGVVEVLISVVVIAVIAGAGWLVYQNRTKSANTTSNSNQINNNQQANTKPQPDPYAGWKTFNNTGYAVATGISLKYPADWQINIPGVGKFGTTSNPTGTINMRSTYYPAASAVTPQVEWETCAATFSADACGAASGDTTVNGSESTINGLAAYTATMHNSYGIYHVTVLRGNTPTSNGIPYVEFTIGSNDSSILSTFATIMASTTFPN